MARENSLHTIKTSRLKAILVVGPSSVDWKRTDAAQNEDSMNMAEKEPQVGPEKAELGIESWK